jgi:hypothetical protein
MCYHWVSLHCVSEIWCCHSEITLDINLSTESSIHKSYVVIKIVTLQFLQLFSLTKPLQNLNSGVPRVFGGFKPPRNSKILTKYQKLRKFCHIKLNLSYQITAASRTPD